MNKVIIDRLFRIGQDSFTTIMYERFLYKLGKQEYAGERPEMVNQLVKHNML